MKALVTGQVTSSNSDLNLLGVKVWTDEETFTVTDVQGMYQLEIPVGPAKIYYRASGYLPTQRIVDIADGPNMMHVNLLKAEDPIFVDVAAGGEFFNSTGARVSIPSDSLVDGEGNPVSGVVDLYLTSIDPTNPAEANVVSNNGLGVDENGESVLLLSFGMLDITVMQDDKELDIAEGSSFEIDIPVPAGRECPSAPIEVWSFNETTSVWDAEGTAICTNNVQCVCTAEIAHMSYWNLDVVREANCVKGIVVDENQNPVSGAFVAGIGPNIFSSNDTTDENGEFVLVVPINEVVNVTIESYPTEVTTTITANSTVLNLSQSGSDLSGIDTAECGDGGEIEVTISEWMACFNGVQDNNETDVDCGGGVCMGCLPCSVDEDSCACEVGSDCATGRCNLDNQCESDICIEVCDFILECGPDFGNDVQQCYAGCQEFPMCSVERDGLANCILGLECDSIQFGEFGFPISCEVETTSYLECVDGQECIGDECPIECEIEIDICTESISCPATPEEPDGCHDGDYHILGESYGGDMSSSWCFEFYTDDFNFQDTDFGGYGSIEALLEANNLQGFPGNCSVACHNEYGNVDSLIFDDNNGEDMIIGGKWHYQYTCEESTDPIYPTPEEVCAAWDECGLGFDSCVRENELTYETAGVCVDNFGIMNSCLLSLDCEGLNAWASGEQNNCSPEIEQYNVCICPPDSPDCF
jgi:hypothetical protein